MNPADWKGKQITKTADNLSVCWKCPIGANTEKGLNLAGQKAVHKVLEDLISVLFPGCHGNEPISEGSMKDHVRNCLEKSLEALKEQVRRALEYQCTVEHDESCRECDDCERKSREIILRLADALPGIQKILQHDIVAAYEGDPAARSTMEVVMSYPGVLAVIVHRIAHVLYKEKAPLVPRIMSEYAHSLTGIDIHPGARIGAGFFIDHGTGVVIGETCTIGENVKLYQGVTLGAQSFAKDSKGRLVKGIKRHPDVGDNVVIYSGATILGGDTKIGANSEIGGNVWLTHSVPEGSRVYNRQPQPVIIGSSSKPRSRKKSRR